MEHNLSKENFFNEMTAQYPERVKYFCDWIDKYKAQNKWDELFKEGIKFHDLPISLQGGLICQFLYNLQPQDDSFRKMMVDGMLEYFNNQEIDLN